MWKSSDAVEAPVAVKTGVQKHGFPWLDNSFPSLEGRYLLGSVSTNITLTAVYSTRDRVRPKG